jgi:hypothetical protein
MFNRTGRKPRHIDPIKKMIAELVQHHLQTVGPSQATRMPNIDYVEVHIIGPTETMLRVKTHNQGTRNFTIKVSENM